MPSNEIYIGEVSISITNKKFGWVKPLLFTQSDDGTAWSPIEDAVTRFPKRGQVFWYDVPETASRFSFWRFSIETSPSYNGLDRQEYYQVSPPVSPVIEVLECEDLSERELRLALTGNGVDLRIAPLGPVLLKIDSSRFVGPVVLEQADELRWRLSDGEKLECLPVRSLSQSTFANVSLAGNREILAPNAKLGTPIRVCNWQSDEEVLIGALNRIGKLDRDSYKELGLTKRVFETYVGALKKAGLISLTSGEQERARVERLKEIQALMEDQAELAEKAVEILLRLDPIATKIESALTDLIEKIEPQERANLRIKIEKDSEELQKLQRGVQDQKQKLTVVKKEVATTEARLKAALQSFDEALKQRVEELRAEPYRAFANVLVDDLFFRGVGLLTRTDAPTAVNTPEVPAAPSAEEVSSIEALHGRLIASMLAQGRSNEVANLYLAGFLSGLPVLALGEKTLHSLSAFAHVACAGRITCVPMSPRFVDVPSLWNEPSGQFRSAMQKALKEPDKLFLLVVDNINVGNPDTAALPILKAHIAATLNGIKYRVPVDGKPEWPKNLLFAMTASRSETAFPVSSSIWRNVVCLVDDAFGSTPAAIYATIAPPCSEVSCTILQKWISSFAGQDLSGMSSVLCNGGAGLVNSIEPFSLRLYGSAMSSKLDPNIVREVVITGTVLPRLVTNGNAEAVASLINENPKFRVAYDQMHSLSFVGSEF